VSGRAQRPVAVNLLDPTESDLRAAASLELASRSVAAVASGAGVNDRRSLWPWLLLACLAILMVEWWIYNRKVMI
jgi:hypothetical protein